jgi:hypothetical protein
LKESSEDRQKIVFVDFIHIYYFTNFLDGKFLGFSGCGYLDPFIFYKKAGSFGGKEKNLETESTLLSRQNGPF